MEITTSTYMPYEDYTSFEEFPYNSGSEAGHRHAAIPVIIIVVILMSLIGNLPVVVISVLYMNRKPLTNVFVLNLALSDLLFTLGLVFWMSEYLWDWTFGNAKCKVDSFFLTTGFYSSLMFLVLMSVQRYMAIVHPLSAWMKGCGSILVPIIAWAVSIFAALPATVHSTSMTDLAGLGFYCTYTSLSAFVAVSCEMNIIFVCAFLFVAFCYITILRTIFKSPTNQNPSHRTTGLAFFLVATFFIIQAFHIILNNKQLRLLRLGSCWLTRTKIEVHVN